MKKTIILLFTVISAMMIAMAAPTSAMASEYETWDGKYTDSFEKNGLYFCITKKKDEARKINGEVWVNASPLEQLSGSLTIPKTVKINESDKAGYNIIGICSHSFAWQDQITDIKIEADIREIGEETFYGCEKLAKINLPSALEYLGARVFLGTGLKEISIPGKVKIIRESTFEGCSSLKKVTMKKSVTRIEESAFSNCAALKTVTLSKKLKTMGTYVFDNCRSLKSITLPDTLKSMGDGCFRSCTSLKKLTLPSGITTVSEILCWDCTSLEKVVFGNNVTNIERSAFMGCGKLTGIKLPSKLKNIGEGAFNGIGIREIEFPKTLENIGASAFASCHKLREVIIPKGVKEIGADAFGECTALQSAQISSTVKVIGDWAFQMCSELSELKLSEGVEKIGEYAFYYTNLSEIDFPKSVTTMYETSFVETPFMHNLISKIHEDKGLFDYYIVNGNMLLANEYDVAEGDYVEKKVYRIPENVKRIICEIGSFITEEIDIPSGVEYMTSIYGSFDDIKLPSALKHIDSIRSSNLKSLELPEALEVLPEIYCESLTSITVPSKITEITCNAPFNGCTNLKKFVLKGKVTSLAAGLLSGTQVTSFSIPDTVEMLGNINEGTELDSVFIPAGVKQIDWQSDSYLKNLEFEEGYNEYTSIEFTYCTNLVNVKLPDSMTRIPRMFYGCTSLKKINLPKNLKVIESMAFAETGITDVTIPKGCEFIETGAFDSGTTLRIHKDSKLLERTEEYVEYGYKIVKYK